MFNSVFDELKEVKYFKKINNVKYFKEIKSFEESSKSRGVFRTQASIYDGAFFVNILNGLLILQYNVGLAYIEASENWNLQSEAKWSNS